MSYQVRVNDRGIVKLYSCDTKQEAESKASQFPIVPGVTVNILEVIPVEKKEKKNA